jgi:GTP cyclohydrolase I
MSRDKNIESAIETILQELGENPKREGLQKTPLRVAKALRFLTQGYFQDPKEVLRGALFTTSNSEMVVVKNIKFYSMCEHHILPIIGEACVAYIPDGRVVGLSKIPRVVDIFARRLQIQEQMTEQIADVIYTTIRPKGVAVKIRARHMCMEMRGVEKVNPETTTLSFKGVFQGDGELRREFHQLLSRE